MEGLNRNATVGLPPIPLPPSNNGSGSFVNEAGNGETEPISQTQAPQNREQDPNVDPKKLRRIMASRQYSQKYRLKLLHYTAELETEVKALQAQVAITCPRIRYSDSQNLLLRAENHSIKQKLSNVSGELMYKQAEYEELKNERNIFQQFYVSVCQQLQLSEMQTANPGNHQSANIGLNQPADQANQFMEPGVLQMPKQGIDQYGNGSGEIVEMNSSNADPSYSFM